MSSEIEFLQAKIQLLTQQLNTLNSLTACHCKKTDCKRCQLDTQIRQSIADQSTCTFFEMQASIVENLAFPVMLRKMWSGEEVKSWLTERADLIRSQCNTLRLTQ